MNDDQLRDRIGRLDPLIDGASIEPVTSSTARALLEDIMSTPVSNEPTPAQHQSRRPSWRIVGVAAAAVAALGIGIAVVNSGGDGDGEIAITTTAPAADDTTAPTQAPGKVKVLDLTAGAEDLTAMCIRLDASILRDVEVAFKGTVTMSENGIVQLTIDQAYKGTDAGAATLSAPQGMEALIGGMAFDVGQQYLIAAVNGTVNYCGQSGPVTPELQALYDEAFAA